MTRLYITRHGETQWNTEKRWQGWKDSPLTDLGRMQATWLGERLKGVEFHGVYASPLKRTMETAKLICEGRNLNIVTQEDFKEINMGTWEGMSQEEIEQIDKEQVDNFWYTPKLYVPTCGGESFEEVITRTKRGIETILTNHKDENILIVSHGVAVKAMMLCFEDRSLDNFWDPPFMHQTSLTIVEINEGQNKIIVQGDTSHYRK